MFNCTELILKELQIYKELRDKDHQKRKTK